MGNNQKKPFEKVDLFIEVQKNIYESGETISGKVCLNTQTEKLPYEKMTLGFYCRETILLKASKEKDSSYETAEKFSYISEIVLHDFTESQLTKGQYSFPFEIKLPESMPSSFSLPGKNNGKDEDPHKIEIKYALKAELSKNLIPTKQYDDLTKVHYLNIVKPLKSTIQPLNVKKSELGRSCLCFGKFSTQISIFVDKNFVFSGDKLQINGQVDNMYGGRNLESFNCQLIERNIVTNEKKLFYKEKQRGVLHLVKNFYVKKGVVQNFSFSYKIPDYLEHSSSIGNFSALGYILRFQYQFKGGFHPNRMIEIPILIQTRTPKFEVNIDEIPSSYQWNPTQQDLTVLPMDQQFTYNSEYPLEKYRTELEKVRNDVPSFQYFNKMDAGYPTKNVTSQSNAKPQPNNTTNDVNPYAMQTDKGLKPDEAQNIPRRKIFGKPSQQGQV